MLGRTLMALVAPLVFLAACGTETKTAATIAEDSALAHDIAMAGRDSLAEPVMTDLSTGSPASDSVALSTEPVAVSLAPAPPKPPPNSRAAAAAVRSETEKSAARVEEKKPASRVPDPRAKVAVPRLAARAPAVSLAKPTADPASGRAVPARPTTSAPPLPLPETPPPEAEEPESAQPETPVAESESDDRVRAGSGAAPAPRSGGGRVLDPVSSEPASGRIPAGATLALNSRSRICTNVHSVGQTFNATVARPVSGAGGAVIPAGATALVEITELRRGGTEGEPIRMGFRVESVTFGGNSYPVSATATSAAISRIRKKSSTGQAEPISPSAEADGCVPTGGRINARLNSSIRF